ncbi:DNA topoisomerase IB [Parvularcula dongshanensis]|uniref:DNA topoisomerase n=1 Tax=Parvularcula dongshanensis TaxID=1173995 RepID=A0A840I4W9_9PROT|nr:DNA topoisomerase IB [Parvularcula dongshanensis]MBB4659412.1 DNA topoisomerase-1 [Parvularcula dongshanensis]
MSETADAEAEARAHARAAGLRYSSDGEPGIKRVRRGRGFSYYGPDESLLTTGPDRERCEALAIPPAYEDVWICVDARGHLQATGRDARSRKTYRYHDDWRSFRDTVKFEGLSAFGGRLGRAREQAEAARRKRGLKKERLLGAVFHLLDHHALRVGNEAYAQENESFGATTLRHEHVAGDVVHFPAKHGREVEVEIDDARFARLVRKLSDLPGQALFQYQDEGGTLHRLHSHDVNDYLEEVFGTPVTAKQFRTWAGSLAAFERGAQDGAGIGDAVEAAAARLQNTKAVARKAYVHPAIIEAVREGSLPEAVRALRPKVGKRKNLTRTEALFLRWLDEAG